MAKIFFSHYLNNENLEREHVLNNFFKKHFQKEFAENGAHCVCFRLPFNFKLKEKS